MVRCRKKHKGKEKVVRARGIRPHRVVHRAHRAGTFLLSHHLVTPKVLEQQTYYLSQANHCPRMRGTGIRFAL